MNKLELPDNALTEAVKTADKHVGQTYDNLTAPVTQSTGTGLSNIVDLVFSPFKYFNDKAALYYQHKLTVYKKELEEKEKDIPEEKKKEPDFQAVSLALDNSKFCITNDDLRKMFVNLITNTMNSDMQGIAHPAFSEIIKQMTSLDAKLLKSFEANKYQPIVEIRTPKGDDGYTVIYNNFFLPSAEIETTIDSCSVSISNLRRLGLVNITYSEWLNDAKNYQAHEEYVNKFHSGNEYQKGLVTLTPVGEKFIQVCFD